MPTPTNPRMLRAASIREAALRLASPTTPELETAYAEAVTSLRRYSRLLTAAYSARENDDDPAVDELHRRCMFVIVAVTAVEAAHGDERAREHLRILAGAGRP